MTVTDNMLRDIAQYLGGSIGYVAIGTGAAPTESSTTLPGEVIRKAADVLIDDNACVLEMFLDETEGNGVTYKNAGAIGGAATPSIGSGTLMVGGVINKPKTSDESLTVSIEITVERA